MEIFLSPHFQNKYKKIKKKNKNLANKLDKKFDLFRKNPNHPSLRLHKLTGRKNQWSISIKRNLRVIFQYVKSGVLLVDIGSHKEVY